MPDYSNASNALPALMHKVLNWGYDVPSRNGLCRELTMQQITLKDPLPAEITTPGRKVSLPAQIAETMWLLAGRNDVEWLSHYLPRAKDFSDDGETWRGGYGPRIRKWQLRSTIDGKPAEIDQLAHVVQLLKEDPGTRRAVIQIYDPAIDTKPGKDIPCNNWVHLLPRDGVLHGHVAIRSNDLMWGWSGINAFEWTKLLQVVAGLTGLRVGSLTFSISSLHLYEPHWAKAQKIVKETEGRTLPTYKQQPEFEWDPSDGVLAFDLLVQQWFQVEGQIRKGGLSTTLLDQVSNFPEPMLRSWLQVLLAWHHNDLSLLPAKLDGTSLQEALRNSPKRKPANQAPNPSPAPVSHSTPLRQAFTQAVSKLHGEKHQAYGDSWKKRGELIGIMANCARKVDRLGVEGGGDSSADTVIDLLVYLVKYHMWLQQDEAKWPTGGVAHVRRVSEELLAAARDLPPADDLATERIVENAKYLFSKLETEATHGSPDRVGTVRQLIRTVYPLAVRLWALENPKETWQAGNSTRPFNGYQENQ